MNDQLELAHTFEHIVASTWLFETDINVTVEYRQRHPNDPLDWWIVGISVERDDVLRRRRVFIDIPSSDPFARLMIEALNKDEAFADKVANLALEREAA